MEASSRKWRDGVERKEQETHAMDEDVAECLSELDGDVPLEIKFKDVSVKHRKRWSETKEGLTEMGEKVDKVGKTPSNR